MSGFTGIFRENSIKPFLLLLLGTIITCLYFWLSSRYPDLNAKASLGPNAPISSLGFSPIIHVNEDAGFWYKVFAETVNWANTNKKGMSFAFVLGAFMLSLLPLFKRPRTGIGALDSLLGFIVGAPLGVCVNCAAPISKSMLAAGASAQFSLSVLITSPTMNVIVLMMAFTFFPAYLVALKIVLTIIFALILVPIGCRYAFKSDVDYVHSHLEETQHIDHKDCENIPNTWLGAVLWSVKSYAKNFVYLLKVALPLMILAGFLGSLLSISIPWDNIQAIDGSYDKTFGMIFIMLAIGVFGAFLPCPISFDIVLASSLLMAGVPIHYVAIFLFTLGSFSIYAFFIVWQSISSRAAIYMYICTVLLGVLMGLITLHINEWNQNSALKQIDNAQISSQNIIQTDAEENAQETQDNKENKDNFDDILHREDRAFSYKDIKSRINSPAQSRLNLTDLPNKLEIYKIGDEFGIKETPGFKLELGDIYGIQQPYEISYISYITDALPHATMGITAGDVHNDGWPDILLSGDMEVSPNLILYTNINGSQFIRQSLPVFGGENAAVVSALFDLDGDSWKDILVTTMNGQVHILYNEDGEFDEKNSKLISQSDGIPTSVSFGDIEGDGDIDIFVGHWSAGPDFINRPESRNVILLSDGQGNYSKQELEGITGETLTSLFHDFDQDGILDLYVGNDTDVHAMSDQIYKGYADGSMRPFDNDLIKGIKGAASSMSIDKGDINNDLQPDFYIAQIAYSGHFIHAMKKISERQIRLDKFCEQYSIQSGQNIDDCKKDIHLKMALGRATFLNSDACYILSDEKQKTKCMIHFYVYNNFCMSGQIKDIARFKDKISQRYMNFCNKKSDRDEFIDFDNQQGILRSSNFSSGNILLRQNNDQNSEKINYSDEAISRQASFGAWSWNSRFFDADNDGWQDIYVVNGIPFSISAAMNVFYRNLGDGNFEEVAADYGLNSFANSSSYTIVDYNKDGFQDIISTPTDGPVEMLTSKGGGKSIRFELSDATSKNSQALGAQITIFYTDKNGKTLQQMQEIKSSGGYRSYNEPVAHFGVADADSIDQIIIKWPDGKVSEINSALPTGQNYLINRK